ncbi:hypothetical protein H0O02_03865 [Candidatus Micrarchaeota archaeon]|nr:hypothetical protein [Candidatus Micrarchaeota archaeon]
MNARMFFQQEMPKSNCAAKSNFRKYFIEPAGIVGRSIKKCAAAGLLSAALLNGGCGTTISLIARNQVKVAAEASPQEIQKAEKEKKHMLACGVGFDIGAALGGIPTAAALKANQDKLTLGDKNDTPLGDNHIALFSLAAVVGASFIFGGIICAATDPSPGGGMPSMPTYSPGGPVGVSPWH